MNILKYQDTIESLVFEEDKVDFKGMKKMSFYLKMIELFQQKTRQIMAFINCRP